MPGLGWRAWAERRRPHAPGATAALGADEPAGTVGGGGWGAGATPAAAAGARTAPLAARRCRVRGGRGETGRGERGARGASHSTPAGRGTPVGGSPRRPAGQTARQMGGGVRGGSGPRRRRRRNPSPCILQCIHRVGDGDPLQDLSPHGGHAARPPTDTHDSFGLPAGPASRLPAPPPPTPPCTSARPISAVGGPTCQVLERAVHGGKLHS